jgi:hypothetical protein
MMSRSSNPGRQWLNANSEVIKVRPLLDAAIYLCAAAAIEWRLFSLSYLPVKPGQNGRLTLESLVLLVTLFLFVVVYVRLVLDPTLGKTKKLISAAVNGCAAALAAYYILSLHGPPPNEGSFSAVIIYFCCRDSGPVYPERRSDSLQSDSRLLRRYGRRIPCLGLSSVVCSCVVDFPKFLP